MSIPMPGPEVGVYVISVAAQLSGLHPQTLRTYERLGLITPQRTGGGGRRYSHRDIELLREISQLTSEGIGLEGVRRILELEHQVDALTARNLELGSEVDKLREGLRTAVAARRQAVDASRPVSRVPALRKPDPTQSIVMWRRGTPSS